MEISNIILQVADLERSLAFYRDLLGLRLLHADGAFAFLDGGGVTLALNQLPTEFPDTEETIEIVFQVEDVHTTHTALTGRGVEFRVEPRVVTEMDGRSLIAADFRDPDGHVLSITGWVQATSGSEVEPVD